MYFGVILFVNSDFLKYVLLNTLNAISILLCSRSKWSIKISPMCCLDLVGGKGTYLSVPGEDGGFIIIILNMLLMIFLEWNVEGERERERDTAGCLPTGDGTARNLGTWPNRESNLQPFHAWDNAQPIEPLQPGPRWWLFKQHCFTAIRIGFLTYMPTKTTSGNNLLCGQDGKRCQIAVMS